MWCVYLWQRFILRTLVRRGQAWKIIIISIVFVWITTRFAISSLLLLYCWFYYFGWCWTIFNFCWLIDILDDCGVTLHRAIGIVEISSLSLYELELWILILFFFCRILTLLIEFLCLILKTFRQIKGYTYVGNK